MEQISPVSRALNSVAFGISVMGLIFSLPFFLVDFRTVAGRFFLQVVGEPFFDYVYGVSWLIAILAALTFYQTIHSILLLLLQFVFSIGGRKGGF